MAIDLLDSLPIVIAVVGGVVGTVVAIITQKRSLAKEVKDHTDLRVNSLQEVMETKLQTIEYKVTVHENLLVEIKKVNKDEVILIKQELQSIRDEITEMHKEGSTASQHRALLLENRINTLEKKVDNILERAFSDKKTSI